jgi:hypothetical protein
MRSPRSTRKSLSEFGGFVSALSDIALSYIAGTFGLERNMAFEGAAAEQMV